MDLGATTLRRLAYAAALALVSAGSARGQGDCDEARRQAEKSYGAGLFEDVPEQLAPCLKAQTSRAVAAEVHYLLARTYLATDETLKARQEASAILRIDSTFEAAGAPPRFVALLAQIRREEATVQVASVSKTKESLREAPATVVVVTREEIERRGYLDLEQLLHDLPGFDIARTKGDVYANIYQRGFYTRYSDRILFLVDGVEQNDLTSNVLFLSRQYALSSIDRVEVIYGPASTLYGANAYSGVINVLTKEPEALLAEGRAIGASAQVAYGDIDARMADVALFGKDRSGNVSWLVNGHVFHGRDMDLSRREDWDFNYDSVDYAGAMRLVGPRARKFRRAHSCAENASPYYRCVRDEAGQLMAIEATKEGERLARELDRRLIRESGVRFDDRANDGTVHAMLRISGLTLGLDVSRTAEGTGSAYKDLALDGRGSSATRETSLYARYSRPVGRDLVLNIFERYLQSSFDRVGSDISFLQLYANGALSLWNMVAPCTDPNQAFRLVGCPSSPWIQRTLLGASSTQFRNELSVVYQPSGRLSGVAGLELIKGSIGQQDQVAIDPRGQRVVLVPQDQVEHTDLGFYAQVAYKLRPDLKAVLAGRVSYNEINNRSGASGFGTLFTPRSALIYTPGRFTFKAIYSEAFKDPADFQKFGTLPLVYNAPSDGLRPERVKNMELSAGWQPTGASSFELGVYQASYSDVVALRPAVIPNCKDPGCAKWVNHDKIRIRGLQATGQYRRGRMALWANYTYTEPVQTNPDNGVGGPLLDEGGRRIRELRVGEIARNHFNTGVDLDLASNLSLDMRGRFVDVRPTGKGTTVAGNPLRKVDRYTVADATLSYRTPLPGMTLQLIAKNLFDRSYFDPGRDTDSIGAAQIPQDGRAILWRVIFAPWHSPGRSGIRDRSAGGDS